MENIQRAREAIDRVGSATVDLKRLRDQVACSVGADNEERASELARVLSEGNKNCAVAKRSLEDVHEKLKSISDEGERRILENLYDVARHKLVDAVRAYQTAQYEYRRVFKQVNIRRAGIVDASVTSATDVKDASETIRATMLGASVYVDAVEKYREVLALEKSVEELYRLFMDLAVLVEDQGHILDDIEQNVNHAREAVQNGNSQLALAVKARKSTRRRMCCCIMIVVVILAIVLGSVLAAFK